MIAIVRDGMTVLMHKLSVVVVLLGAMQVARAENKPPQLSVMTPKVLVGSADVVAVSKVVKASAPRLLACYRAALESERIQGTATVKVRIAVDGKVSSATVTGLAPQETAPVHNCIAGIVSTLKFAKPKAGEVVDLAIPLVFSSPDDFADANLYGGLNGTDLGEMKGGFGYGNLGAGGGGTGWGTIGTGGYGTIGYGSGRKTTAANVSIGELTVQGDLDKAIIRRYIKRNIQKITYCYEKELVSKKDLAGNLQTQFTIGVNGLVTSSTATGVDPNVATCVANVITGIEFPRPKAGPVAVTYPFTMRPPAEPVKEPAKKPAKK